MKRLIFVLLLSFMWVMADSADARGRGGRGGGGRGGGGRGGGGRGGGSRGGGRSPSFSRSGGGGGSRSISRPSGGGGGGRSPSMSRPSQRPSGGGGLNRPSGGARPSQRPSGGMANRPGGGNRPSQLPSGGMANRPGSGGIGNRPGGGPGGGMGNRPGGGRGDVGNFLGIQSPGGIGGAGGIGGGRGGLLGPGGAGRPGGIGGVGGVGGAGRPGGIGGVGGVGGAGRPGGIGGVGGVGGAGRPGGIGGVGGIGGAGRPGGVGGVGGVGRPGGVGGVGGAGGLGNRASQLPARGDRAGWNNFRSNQANSIRNISGNNVNFNRVANRPGGWWGGGYGGYGRGFARGWAASGNWNGWGSCWGWHGWSPGMWWGVGTSAVALGSWITGMAMSGSSGSSEPAYIDYGDNVYVDNSTVYRDSQPIASQQEYAEQAIQYASVEVPPPPEMPEGEATPDQDAAMQEFADNWMPLGVFAVSSGKDDNVPPKYFLQLAVSKDGYIAGTCFDSIKDQTYPLTGSVDKKSQRAAWKLADQPDMVMETGIFNLTQDTAPAMVHFGKDKSDTRLLVRMEENKEGQAASGAPPS